MTQNQYDHPKDVYFSSEDSNFLTGDSPATLDVNATLGRNSVDGYVTNDGPGDFTINLSKDGTTYGQNITLKVGEQLNLRALNIDTIKITWVSDSAYRVFAV